MRDRPARAVHDHQPAATPLRRRRLRDQVVGKLEIEVGSKQDEILVHDRSVLVDALLVNESGSPDGLGLPPLFTQDGPQHLVQELAILEERPAQDAFLDRA